MLRWLLSRRPFRAGPFTLDSLACPVALHSVVPRGIPATAARAASRPHSTASCGQAARSAAVLVMQPFRPVFLHARLPRMEKRPSLGRPATNAAPRPRHTAPCPCSPRLDYLAVENGTLLRGPYVYRSAPRCSLKLRLTRLSEPGCCARGYGNPVSRLSVHARLPRVPGPAPLGCPRKQPGTAARALARPHSTTSCGRRARFAAWSAGNRSGPVLPCSTASHGRTPSTGVFGNRRCSRIPPRSAPCHGLCGDTSRARLSAPPKRNSLRSCLPPATSRQPSASALLSAAVNRLHVAAPFQVPPRQRALHAHGSHVSPDPGLLRRPGTDLPRVPRARLAAFAPTRSEVGASASSVGLCPEAFLYVPRYRARPRDRRQVTHVAPLLPPSPPFRPCRRLRTLAATPQLRGRSRGPSPSSRPDSRLRPYAPAALIGNSRCVRSSQASQQTHPLLPGALRLPLLSRRLLPPTAEAPVAPASPAELASLVLAPGHVKATVGVSVTLRRRRSPSRDRPFQYPQRARRQALAVMAMPSPLAVDRIRLRLLRSTDSLPPHFAAPVPPACHTFCVPDGGRLCAKPPSGVRYAHLNAHHLRRFAPSVRAPLEEEDKAHGEPGDAPRPGTAAEPCGSALECRPNYVGPPPAQHRITGPLCGR